MAYEVVMPYHLHMPSYFLETFTEYPYLVPEDKAHPLCHPSPSYDSLCPTSILIQPYPQYPSRHTQIPASRYHIGKRGSFYLHKSGYVIMTN